MMWHFLLRFVPFCSSRFSPTAPVTPSKAKRRKLGGENKNLDSGLNVSRWWKQYSKLAVGCRNSRRWSKNAYLFLSGCSNLSEPHVRLPWITKVWRKSSLLTFRNLLADIQQAARWKTSVTFIQHGSCTCGKFWDNGFAFVLRLAFALSLLVLYTWYFLYSLLKKRLLSDCHSAAVTFALALKISLKTCWASEPSQDSFQLQCCGFLWNRDAHRLGCVLFFTTFVSLDIWMQMTFWQLPFVQHKPMFASTFFVSTSLLERN